MVKTQVGIVRKQLTVEINIIIKINDQLLINNDHLFHRKNALSFFYLSGNNIFRLQPIHILSFFFGIYNAHLIQRKVHYLYFSLFFCLILSLPSLFVKSSVCLKHHSFLFSFIMSVFKFLITILLTYSFIIPVSYTHLTLPTIYSV